MKNTLIIVPKSSGAKLKNRIRDWLGIHVRGATSARKIDFESSLTPKRAFELFGDAVQEEALQSAARYDWVIEVRYKQGVTDTATLTASAAAGEPVQCSQLTLIQGDLPFADVERLTVELLANPLIQEYSITRSRRVAVEEVDLDQQLGLALSAQEVDAIKTWYAREEVQEARRTLNLPKGPTDVEIECLAQTWSEHCKHKIFNATIHMQGKTVRSLFKTYIAAATEKLAPEKPWLLSVFKDNAGIVALNDEYSFCFKVETHNSPSALDPYGGALTGILGVNRDIMGAGLGARLVANTNVLCFASPSTTRVPKGLHHPKRVREGVRLGIEHGGNKSGVPTINGALLYDPSYIGKPLVYCGSVGILPRKIQGRLTHLKEILPGDRVIIAGGRTGKDGIHGATFSSEELSSTSPSGAVQIGDPFTQKKVHDFLLEAQQNLLYRTLTDNGAGGFSSSVGELATLSGGARIDLKNALLKYPGLMPWEILVSESQERMTLAVPEENLAALQELAKVHEVELCDLGAFTDSGLFEVLFEGQRAAYLPLDFLHGGTPTLELEASWTPPPYKEPCLEGIEAGDALIELLSDENICSREELIRQYDHEVQGGTVVKPLAGWDGNGPNDAGVIVPLELLESENPPGLAVSCGIQPWLGALDPYAMACAAIDEAVRGVVAVGCDPDRTSILDNFCWPDPCKEPEKLGKLVRACEGLYDAALGLKVPLISGKDSMKNDAVVEGEKISVLPTLLISAIGIVPDATKCVTSDFKRAGDLIYLLGETKEELGGSSLLRLYRIEGGSPPKLNAHEALERYRNLHRAIALGLVASCHDLSDGGLGVALAESAFGGGLGAQVDLNDGLPPLVALYAESLSRLLVTVSPQNQKAFEELCAGTLLGSVTAEPHLVVSSGGKVVLREHLETLQAAWRNG